MPLDMLDSQITGNMLRANPKTLKRMIANLLDSDYSPKKVVKTLRKQYGLSKKTIDKRMDVVLSARPALKKPVKKPAVIDSMDKPLPPLSILSARYKEFDDHYKIYEQALRLKFYLGHMFEAAEFRNTGVNTGNRYTDLDNFDSTSERAPIGQVQKSEHGRYVKVYPDYVETIVDLIDTSFLLVNIGYVNSEFANKNRLAAGRIIQTYFPDFKIPTEWSMVKEDHPYEEGKTVTVVRTNLPTLTAEYTLDKLATLRPNYTHANDQTEERTRWKHPDYIKTPAGFPKKFGQIASLRLTLEGEQANLSTEYKARSSGMQSGTIGSLGLGTRITIPISVELVIRWPKEFACYVTSCRTYKDFIPFLFYQYISYHRVAYGGMRTGKGAFTLTAPTRVNHLGLILEDIEQEKAKGINPKPKTNEDDMLIVGLAEPSMTGEVLWIPRDENRVKEYVRQIKDSHNKDTNNIEFHGFSLKGKGLLTDWHHEKFSYVRESGLGSATDAADASGIQTFDLLGSRPLDVITINRDLNRFVNTDADSLKAFAGYLHKFANTGMDSTTQFAKPANDYHSPEYLATDPDYAKYQRILRKSIVDLMGLLITSPVGITIGNIGGIPIDTDEPDMYTLEKVICRFIKTVAEDAFKEFNSLEMGYQARMSMRYYFLLILKYAKDYKEYKKVADEIEAKNRIGSEIISDQERTQKYGDIAKVKVPNLPGLQMMLPHQIESSVVLESEPAACFTDVHMGGGKCQYFNAIIPTSKGILKIGELYDQFSGAPSIEKGFKLADFKVSMAGKPTQATHTYRTKGKMVTLVTKEGDRFRSLKEHKLWVLLPDGSINFKPVDDIVPGDWLPKIIASRLFPDKKPKEMSLALARILGFLVAEGHVARSNVVMTNSCPEVNAQFLADWEEVFGRRDLRSNLRGNCIQYYSNKTEQDKLLSFGLINGLSNKVEVPLLVRRSPESYQKEFLQTLFEGDGTVYRKDGGKGKYFRYVIEYDTISKILAQQVKHMLENMGIACSIRTSQKHATNTEAQRNVLCYTLRIAPSYHVEFKARVGFFSERKKELLEEATDHWQKITLLGDKRAQNFETCGFENRLPVGNYVVQLLNRIQTLLSNHTFVTASNQNRQCSINWFWCNTGDFAGKHARGLAANINRRLLNSGETVSRYYVDMLLTAIDKQPANIKHAIVSDNKATSLIDCIKNVQKYLWTSVKSKRYSSKVVNAYDISVPGPHAYVANGFTSHNTLIGTLEALQLIFKKKIKRPLFVVPSSLVRSWINEINHYSKGEVNPFAITLRSMRRLQEALEIGDYKSPTNQVSYDLVRAIIEGCPPNTVFITSYNYLRSDNEKVLYANKDVIRYLAAESLRDIGFEAVFLDESHKAKNLGTAQTKATAVLTSAAKIVRMMSGTLVNNTLTDLVGQAAMANPAIYGRAKDFNRKYGDGNAGTVTVWQADAQQRMIDDAKSYMQRITHKRQRWAFVLPKLEENFYPVPFTKRQQEFYDSTLDQVMEKFLADPKLRNKLSKMTEAEQSAIMKKLQEDPAFQKLEEFVYAPDTNEGFMALDDLEDEDMVSPKMPKLLELLDTHFAPQKDIKTGKSTPQQHKVLVFGYRKVTSEHIIKHLPPHYKKMAVHYTAGDLSALEMFLKNPKIQILVANETSINTGQNLQIASRLIRMETLWSPGDQDQALARIWRPDFKSLVSRPVVYSDWIFTDGSLEVAKIGRIVSKIVDKMKYDWQESPQFSKTPFHFPEGSLKSSIRRHIPSIDSNIPVNDMLLSLPLISMNIESLRNLRRYSQIANYFATFSLISNWENIEFERQKGQKWAKVSEVPKESYVKIPNSARLAWLPRVEGVDPDIIDPENKFGYKPISVVESALALSDDDDNENVNTVEVNAASVNDIVDTEFGVGFITKILNDRVTVRIPGIENEIKVPKAATWLITNPEMVAILKKKIRSAGKAGLARLPGSVIEDQLNEKAPGAKPPKVEKERGAADTRGGGGKPNLPRLPRPSQDTHYDEDVDTTDGDNEIGIYGEIIDGQIALTCLAEDLDSELLTDNFDFKPVAPYYAVKVRTAKALASLVNLLKSKFVIKNTLVNNFTPYIDMLQEKKLGLHDPAQFAETLQFFRITNHKQAVDNEIRPFPIVWGGKMFIAVDKKMTKASAKFLRVCRTSGIPGVTLPEEPLQDGVHVRMFKSKASAIAALYEIHKKVKVTNLDETLAFLRGLRSTKLDREEDDTPPVRNTPKSAPKATQVKVVKKNLPKVAPTRVKPKANIVEDYDEEVEIPARKPKTRR